MHSILFGSLVMHKSLHIFICFFCLFSGTISAQRSVSIGGGSYASYAPLSASRTAERGGSQAYQMEHRRLYLPDSLLSRLGSPDGSVNGTLALPTNDWWTYALVNAWTGKIWFYPGWVEATEQGVEVGYPTFWEPTGCEVKWNTPLSLSFTNESTGKRAAFIEALVDNWSDFMMSFIMLDNSSASTNESGAWVRVTCVHGSPIVWVEAQGIAVNVANPDASKYYVSQQVVNGKQWTAIALLTNGIDAAKIDYHAQRVPRSTLISYDYKASEAMLSTTFSVVKEDIRTHVYSASTPSLIAFLPHHIYSDQVSVNGNTDAPTYIGEYLSPRGTMKVLEGADFTFAYQVHGMLPFFPAPREWKEGFSAARMQQLNSDYAARGTFGGDTYWGGKGLTQMMHYMTFALQMGDTATFRLAKQRLKENLIDWYTYTPGEERRYFAHYPRWGALIGFDCSYDSDTFNDHHFHYGYFVYASAVLCMLDDDFREQYGAIAREVARDYANWKTASHPEQGILEPWFRTLDPYCGHSFAGGMGNGGNGNGQESTSEAIQGWGGVWMLGAALGDQEMLEAGIFGYTLETRAAAEYWFDRNRRNIDYTKYSHPYCCNLTMQGVGWWTWFSGDPVWMHSIQWLPISPILTNFFSEDLNFTRWDYTQMYLGKEVADYEATTGGLGDESGLGNVCLSYLSLVDADSAARIWDRMDRMNKALAKNPDTGGITYWLAHSHKALGEKRYDILADYPLACAYTDTITGRMTYAVYNCGTTDKQVRFFGAADTTVMAPVGLTLYDGQAPLNIPTIADDSAVVQKDSLAWDYVYPNLALGKSVTASSYENAGTLPININDGDQNTRWGSAHADNEYITIDLGETCYIDHLVLRWEAAYASRYAIGLSHDAESYKQIELSASGGVETVNLAKQMMAQGLTSRGRYLRLTGIERATQYGTSLYEIEAYGRPLNGDTTAIFVFALAAEDTVLTDSESTRVHAYGLDINGNQKPVTPTYAIQSGAATIVGNLVTTTAAGRVVVQADYGEMTATLTLIVLEGEKASQLTVTPVEVTLPLGESAEFIVCSVNQFGYALDSCFFTYNGIYVCDTTLRFDCQGMQIEAVAHVQPYSAMNLALNKHVTASSYENAGTLPQGINDGKMDTRWGSAHRDNEWIEIDLGDCYLLEKVRMVWEAAYATSYDLMLSDDGSEYAVIYSATNAMGGTQTINLPAQSHGRYIQLFCKTRSTGYGSSLYELEVYGTGKCDSPATGLIESPDDSINTKNTCQKILHEGNMFILRDGKMYSIMGQKVRF